MLLVNYKQKFYAILTSSFLYLAAFHGDREMNGIEGSVLYTVEYTNKDCSECFKVMDHATTKFQVKIKEALHISWEQPPLNKQLYHVYLTLSF